MSARDAGFALVSSGWMLLEGFTGNEVRLVEVRGSHPSTKNVEGWGTRIFWDGQDFKNLGCANGPETKVGWLGLVVSQVPKGEAPGAPVIRGGTHF